MEKIYEQRTFDESVVVAEGARVVGDVTLGKNVNIWYNAVLRGDSGAIVIGDDTNVQDGAIIHAKTTVGKGCSIAHGVIVHGCTIGDDVLVGMGAIVINGAKIGNNCIIGAGTLVTGTMDAPDGSMILGSPGKVVRSLTEKEIERIHKNRDIYLAHAKNFLEERARAEQE